MKGKNNTLIIDAYNANPSSMRVSLENFRNLQAKTKALIIGDMLELGTESTKEHKAILELISDINPQKIFLVGKEFRNAAENNKYFQDKALFFENSLLLRDYLKENPIKNFSILIKGSRGTKLENTIETL